MTVERRTLIILLIIVALGAALRLWNLGTAELTFDEGLYAFRSVGYLDYLENPAQPTPIQWFAGKALPWWTRLSFHDHPPLVFLVQHAATLLLGDTLFAARLPSAFAGIALIILLFFITRRLFNAPYADIFALGAAALASVSFPLLFTSHLAMQESLLLAFMLWNIHAFLRFTENERRWPMFGATLGLVMLTKYVGILLVPAYIAYLLITRREMLRRKAFYLGMFLALILSTPVIIYNIALYRAQGHFDLQFSYLLRTMPPYWQGESGKTQEPFTNIISNLRALYAIPLLVAVLAGIAAAGASKERRRQLALPLLLFVATTLLLFMTGSALRFSALYMLSFIPLALLPFAALHEKGYRTLAYTLFALLIAGEAWFGIRNEFVNAPNYGVAELDRYIDAVLGGGRPTLTVRHPNPHLDRVIRRYANKLPMTIAPTAIIYDDNIATNPMLWLFGRRQYYHGVPVMPANVFRKAVVAENGARFRDVALYFVKGEPAAPLRGQLTNDAAIVERALKDAKTSPLITILGDDNVPAFRMYKFSL